MPGAVDGNDLEGRWIMEGKIWEFCKGITDLFEGNDLEGKGNENKRCGTLLRFGGLEVWKAISPTFLNKDPAREVPRPQ